MKNTVFLLLVFQFLQPTFLGLESVTEFIPYASIYMAIWYIASIIFRTNKMYCNKIKVNKYCTVVCFLLLLYALLVSFAYNQFSLKSFVLIFSPIICIHVFLFYQQKISLDIKPSNGTFKFAWISWMVALAFQLISPSIYTQFASLFLPRENVLVDDRGLSGLATEPSFAAEIMLLFYVVWRLNRNSFKPKENYFFIITLALAVFLNGSATIYGLAFACGAIEWIVKRIQRLVEFQKLSGKQSLASSPLIRSKSKIRTIPTVLALGCSGMIIYMLGLLPSRLMSIFSAENTSFISTRDFLYKFTLIGMGSWRTISNYVGISIGFNNFPFGRGLGSGDIAFSDFMYEKFGSYDNTLHTWISTTFTFFPFTMSDLGLIFSLGLMYYICVSTKIMLLLRNYPLKGAMVIFGLVCITIVSPKSSLTPWFIILYAADEISSDRSPSPDNIIGDA